MQVLGRQRSGRLAIVILATEGSANRRKPTSFQGKKKRSDLLHQNNERKQG
jgi:hypothetical protein